MIFPRFIKIFSIVVIFGFLVSSVESKGKILKCPPLDKIDDLFNDEKGEKFIITFNKSDNEAMKQHFDIMQNCWKRRVKHIIPNKLLNDKNTLMDFSVKGYLNGYCGYFTPSFIDKHLSKMPNINIEKDGPVKINRVLPIARRTTVRNPTKNIDRIDQAKRPLDGRFNFPEGAGEGTNIYIIDTGVRVTHDEFGNRASFGGAFCKNCNDKDEDGHGTQVASIAAGSTYGVARKANIISVRVLDANGDGTKSDIINAMSFVLNEHNKSNNKNTIINMSINGDFSRSMNNVIEDLTNAGIHVVVAAGNDGADACKSSPSSAPTAITVGATEEDSEQIVEFSNIGKCLDIFAPGVKIKGAGNQTDDDVLILSGTSQASPHVAGAIALIISKIGNRSPNEMSTILKRLSAKNVVKGLKDGSPDSFLRTP
jgi:subtilisin family serine protease